MRTNAAVRLWRTLEARELMADYPIYRSVKNAFGEAEEEVKLGQVRGYFSAQAHRVNPHIGALIGFSGMVCEVQTPILFTPHGQAADAGQGDTVVIDGVRYGINRVDSVLDVYDVLSLTPTGGEMHVEESI